jgi:hypothetical protein
MTIDRGQYQTQRLNDAKAQRRKEEKTFFVFPL